MRTVRHRKVSFVIARDWLLATEYQTWLSRLLSKMIGQDLINTDAALKFRSLLQRSTGKNIAGLTWVNSNTRCVFIEQAVDDIHLRLKRFHRRQGAAEFHLGAGTFGPPVILIDAARHEQRGESFGGRAAVGFG